MLPDQRVVNTYVRPDLQYAAAALQSRQGQYDAAEQLNLETQGKYSQYAVRGVDLADREKLVQDYTVQAQEIAEKKYGGDWGAALPEIKALSASTARNPLWGAFTSNLAQEKSYLELEEANRKAGKQTLYFNRDARTKRTRNEDGSINSVSWDAEAQGDWVKARKEALGTIAKSGGSGALTGAGVRGMLKYIDSEGVTGGDVERVAMQGFQGYLTSSEGNQEMKQLLHNGYSRKDAMKMVYQNLVGAGANQVGTITKQHIANDPLAAEKYAAEKDANQINFSTASPSMDFNPGGAVDLDAFELKERYSPKDFQGSRSAYNDGLIETGGGRPLGKTFGKLDGEQVSKYANMLDAVNPELAQRFRTGKQTAADMAQAAPLVKAQAAAFGNQKVAPSVSQIPDTYNFGSYGKGEVGATKMLEAKAPNLVFYDVDGNKPLSGRELTELQNAAAKASQKDGSDNNIRVSGHVSPFNHLGAVANTTQYGDAMQVTWKGKTYIAGGFEQKREGVKTNKKTGAETHYTEDLSSVRRQINEIATKSFNAYGAPVQVREGVYLQQDPSSKKFFFTGPKISEQESVEIGLLDDPTPFLERALGK